MLIHPIISNHMFYIWYIQHLAGPEVKPPLADLKETARSWQLLFFGLLLVFHLKYSQPG